MVLFFALTGSGGFAIDGGGEGVWRTTTTLFWCRVVYSLTTMPFFVFTLPGLNKILTHAAPTGFNALGQCVPFQVPSPKSEVKTRTGETSLDP